METLIKRTKLSAREGYIVNQLCTKGKILPEIQAQEIRSAEKSGDEVLKNLLQNPSSDVYLATSLRSYPDFIKAEAMYEFLETKLNAKVFCPALCGVALEAALGDEPNEKGDIERFFISRSHLFFGLEMEKATWGKYIESAHFLLRGKPAIFIVADNAEEKHLSAFEIFKNRHPMKTAGSAFLAHGPHVVKTIEEGLKCARMELNRKPMSNLAETTTEMNDKTKIRSANYHCPVCGSLLLRSANWLDGI